MKPALQWRFSRDPIGDPRLLPGGAEKGGSATFLMGLPIRSTCLIYPNVYTGLSLDYQLA